jgi:hypothetical protein
MFGRAAILIIKIINNRDMNKAWLDAVADKLERASANVLVAKGFEAAIAVNTAAHLLRECETVGEGQNILRNLKAHLKEQR